ncbi:CdaR family transcriptional regulator [Bacillus horti]|uniref:Carbohydrate diacid regulator n=1 Tax=Caldalkalibacillus horti TaxID=77523 RepID=A0ABT9VT47_9BACI|nr:sugar diacid recognition domain-containing protein [Bacillus horti]MDQ0164156.1 carbohydrate diacid regulator [Bacillus horti]
MKLSPELAQEMVHKTIPIIGTNINIMNEEAKIIGSGQADRLFQYHDGAAQAIRQQKTIEIYATDNIPVGTKPGINMPIAFQGRIIGVVGITGHPHEYRQFAQMVKVYVEMLVEQNDLLQHIQGESKAKDLLLLDFVQGRFQDEIELQNASERANVLQLNLSPPFMLILLEVSLPHSNRNQARSSVVDQTARIAHFMQQYIGKKAHARWISHIQSQLFLILFDPAKLSSYPSPWVELKEEITQLLNIWLEELPAIEGMSTSIGVSGLIPYLSHIHAAYADAQFALTAGKHRNRSLLFFDDIGLMELLYALPTQLKKEYAERTIGPVMDKEKWIASFEAFIENNLNVSHAASQLSIQRSTLLNHLKQIYIHTEKDPTNFKQLVELYLAYIFHTEEELG